MKFLNKQEMVELMKEYPDGGIVFADYSPNANEFEIQVTDGDFGATCVIPREGEVYDYDWNIDEYADNDRFAVFDNNDVLQMIQVLTKGLKIQLKSWFDD